MDWEISTGDPTITEKGGRNRRRTTSTSHQQPKKRKIKRKTIIKMKNGLIGWRCTPAAEAEPSASTGYLPECGADAVEPGTRY